VDTALLRLEVVVAGIAGTARARRRRLADAVEIVALGAVGPVLALGGAEFGIVDAARFGLGADLVARRRRLVARRRRALGHRLLEHRRRMLLVRLQERVLFEHLLDFLLQLERRQLQQADRLLQLRREGQMLREPYLQRRLHVYIRKCSPR
jgi:hypothetical protein